MSTARGQLKSPQSLYATPPPRLSIGHGHEWLTHIPFVPLQTLTLKLQGQSHGCGQRARPYSQPSIYFICFLFVSHQSDNNSWDTAILKFDLEKSGVKVMSEVNGQCHIVHPVSNQCTSFSFHINRTNHSWDMSNRVFDLAKTHPKFSKKIWQKRNFQQNSSKI